MMDYFVDKNSVVRQIWGKSDTVLLIFAGASAEFALNKSVDWLYFTGRLPMDPLGRLFTTVSYAQKIVFAEKQLALHAIESINKIHATVEAKRGAVIPDWAYRDVLFMLIDYSIRSFEELERKLSKTEKDEVFQVFNRLGISMQLIGLPKTFDEWTSMRSKHLLQDLQYSDYTNDLFNQYKKHLGTMRYKILLEAQTLVAPTQVRKLLGLRKFSFLNPVISLYKLSKIMKIDGLLKNFIFPSMYKNEINALDTPLSYSATVK